MRSVDPVAPPRRPVRIRVLIFALWFVGISVPLAMLAIQHNLPFVVRAVNVTGREGTTLSPADRPTILHVLAADCDCSKAVAEGLARRGADDAEREQVWIVGGASELRRRLEQARYVVREISAKEAHDALGVVGAPFLLVYERDGASVKYAGGYSPHRPEDAGDIEVESIVRAVRSGQPTSPYPAYGCIVGQELRRQTDPLGLKYSQDSTRASS
jgi:hypothetical protein